MEVDASRMWNFDRFFEEVTTIVMRLQASYTFHYYSSLIIIVKLLERSSNFE